MWDHLKEPNGMTNDIRWELVALKADFVHLDRLLQMPVRVLPVNVTMPSRYIGSDLSPQLYAAETALSD